MDPRSETLQHSYRKDVERLARGIYLQLIETRRTIENADILPEDKCSILLNAINILTVPAPPETPTNPQQ